MPLRTARRLAGVLGVGVRRAGGAVRDAIRREPYQVVGFRSFGAADRALVLGRVLEDEGIEAADPAHTRWRNLVHAIKRFAADPLPHALVHARLGDARHELQADDEGFLSDWMTLEPSLSSAGWHEMLLELPDPPRGEPVSAASYVLVPPATAAYGVVSDMDDTVLQSEVTNFLRAARMMLLENARTRLPFPGVAAFYRALHDANAGANPIFFVSSSPWNLYDVIADFLEAQEIPVGPLLLRDWDFRPSLLRSKRHKTQHIREIFETYPRLPFILVGDSGQEDPEIYSALVRDFPERVLAVYIRNVSRKPGRAAAIERLATEVRDAGSTLVLADDTLTIARHAVAHGWLAESALPEIGDEKRADEGTTTEKVETPGVETKEAPTVVVDDDVSAREIE